MKIPTSALLFLPLFATATATATAGAATTNVITEKLFNEITAQLESLYQPVIASHQANLKMIRNWQDPKYEAHANRKGQDWYVYVAGGFARQMTPDGLTYALCHEFGHQLGGYPFNNIPGVEWLSTEGQAEYYASFVCLRALWKNQNNSASEFQTEPFAKKECDRVWSTREERRLCYRITNSGQTVIRFWSTEEHLPPPRFSTPETNSEFTPQCRLDTVLQGALCKASFDLKTVPGYLDADGINSPQARLQAESQSCDPKFGYTVGLKPRCWYR